MNQPSYLLRQVQIAILIGFMVFLAAFKCEASDISYQNTLIKKARELDLAHDKQWLSMVYYEKKTFSKNYESIFDSPNFFLAKDGKENPESELEATIRSFFDDQNLPFKNVFNQSQTASCAFIGRYEWLKEKLDFDQSRLPTAKCPAFDDWYKNINPQSATLIFASSYLNNPASMFGHTFLLINNNDKKQTILSSAINYSANTDETNGILFAYRGIFGLYDGKFSIMPYHQMIKKYNNYENRDIWEYDLNLDKHDLRMIMTNLWEINNNYANYYFFSENCSYLLLKLLQIIRSDIDYKKPLTGWVIPSDTVIKISATPGLIKDTRYRASSASKIKHLMNNADDKIIKMAYKISTKKDFDELQDPEFTSFDEHKKKLTYDLSFEYLQYLYQKNAEVNKTDMANLSLKILNHRSHLAGKTELPKIPTPASNPALAHNTRKLAAFYGYNRFRKNFTEIDLRPAYHNLLDDDNGFLKGAQIDVLDLSLRHYAQDNDLRLNHFNLVDIKSYSPRNFFFKPWSWELKTGMEDFYISDQRFGNTVFANFGAGANFDLPKIRSNIALLGFADERYNHNFTGNFSTAFGPKINLNTNLSSTIKLNISAKYNFFVNDKDFNYGEYKIEQNFEMARDVSLRMFFEQKIFENYRNDNEVGIGVNYYF